MSPFPAIAVTLNEDLDGAFRRILAAYHAAGFETRTIESDRGWHTGARMLGTVHDGGFYFFIVVTRPLTEREEDGLMNEVVNLSEAFVKRGEFYFNVYSPFPFSDVVKYTLSDGPRLVFVNNCASLLQDFGAVTPELVPVIATKSVALLHPLRDRLQKQSTPTGLIEHLIVNILRSQKDPDAEDTGFRPDAALTLLGYGFGESLRHTIKQVKNLDARWSAAQGLLGIEIVANVKKGFFSSEECFVLWNNPIGKVFKLFQNGMEDSIVSMEACTIPIIKHELQKKGLKI